MKTLCSCIVCHEIKSTKGIHTHFLIAHNKEYAKKHYDKSIAGFKIAKDSITKNFNNRITKYYLSPTACAHCNTTLPYESRHLTYCSKSCSSSATNSTHSAESRQQQRLSTQSTMYGIEISGDFLPLAKNTCEKCSKVFLSKSPRRFCNEDCRGRKNPTEKIEIVGEFSPLHKCSCKVCHTKFLARTSLQFCKQHRDHHSNKRSEYRFQFNIYDYPDLFNLDLLNTVGFYAPGGKAGKWNPDGLSRDHKVSITEAIKHEYDPYFITHPLNCELMPHSTNNKKKGKSSLTYNELVQLVNEYNGGH